MSYILDALRKSQQDRDLGRVPTLATQPLFRSREPGGRSWGLAATALAGLAVVIALYAALRQAPEGADSSLTVPVAPTTAALGPAAGLYPSGIGPAAQANPAMGQAGTQPPLGPAAVAASPASSPQPPGMSPPVAAAPPAGSPRAQPEANPMPGPPVTRSQVPDYPPTPLALDEAQGVESGGLEEEAPATPPPVPAATASPLAPAGVQGVPDDLRRDIESFKEQVKEGGTAKAKTGKKASAAPAPSPREQRLPKEVEERLPAFLLTVHLFDADPTKRFVILDGRKTRQGESSRNGILVQEILPDGVILVFDGHPFFQPR